MSDEKPPKLCGLCGEQPVGPGGTICPPCRARIEANNENFYAYLDGDPSRPEAL